MKRPVPFARLIKTLTPSGILQCRVNLRETVHLCLTFHHSFTAEDGEGYDGQGIFLGHKSAVFGKVFLCVFSVEKKELSTRTFSFKDRFFRPPMLTLL